MMSLAHSRPLLAAHPLAAVTLTLQSINEQVSASCEGLCAQFVYEQPVMHTMPAMPKLMQHMTDW
jgi:hypothetical protein